MSNHIETAVKMWENMREAAIAVDRDATYSAAYDYGLAVGIYTQYVMDRNLSFEDISDAVGAEAYEDLEDLGAKIQCWLEEGYEKAWKLYHGKELMYEWDPSL